MTFEDIQRKKHRKVLRGLFSYCEDENEKRFSVLGLPLWREYVEQDRCIRSVLGIRTG